MTTMTAASDKKGVRLNAERTQGWLRAVFEACGLTLADAADMAYGVIQPSLRGVDTHGLFRMPQYVENLRKGRVNAHADMRFVTSAGAMAILDADNGLGHVASGRAMRHAVNIAQKQGVGVVSVRNSSHFGASGTWAMLAAEADCIGLSWTNGHATMPPTGGVEARVHNCPLGVAIPAGKHPPLLLDIAMSLVAGARIRVAALQGLPIPPDWALTADGRVTTDATEAMNGLVLPMGAHKGYGLAVVADVLSGILSGSLSGIDVESQGSEALGQRMDARHGSRIGIGHFFLAIDPTFFMELAEFKSRVDRLIDQLHDTKHLEGVARILVPGELESERTAERRREGIPIQDKVLDLVRKAGESVGVPLPADLAV